MRKVIVLVFINRNKVKNIVIPLFFSIAILMASFTTVNVKQYKVRKIVIDPGHGGKDPGNLGSFSKEKDVSLKIALKLGDILKKLQPDIEVIYTRTDDSFPGLVDRANIANKNHADLFISIHCNSVPSKSQNNAHGTETWVMGLHKSDGNLEVAKRENATILLEENYEEKYEGFDPTSPESHILFSLYQNAYIGNSLKLAENIENQFRERVGRNSRGVKQAGFVVLYKSSMPSVLVEVGFLSNNKEEKYLNDDLGQTYIASGIYRAIRDYKEEIESMN
ncbi:MAG: N-acetylmuramoyl-L-alanine amidase [Bacteroidota bacterium]|nr:N-acetylmuramoyl-L-alanine amidase [Bacteroidota bacterium]